MKLNSCIQIVSAAFLVAASSGCESSGGTSSTNQDTKPCGSTWTQVENGNLKKYASHVSSTGSCLVESQALTKWEASSFAFTKNNVQCSPVTTFRSRSIVSASNYYSYRDGRVFISLNAETGLYRRVVLGEDANGKPTFSRLKSCFFERNGQLLLDTNVAKLATSSAVDLWEIFSYTETGLNLNLIRFDSSADWNYTFCSGFRMPWNFCEKIRNGNLVLFPVLSASDQAALLAEAILIRKTYSYVTVSDSTFESLWNSVEKTATESSQENWKYDVIAAPDTPLYTSESWYAYLKNERPAMPDTSSSDSRLVCWRGSESVLLSNGATGKIYGQICWSSADGYSFTN